MRHRLLSHITRILDMRFVLFLAFLTAIIFFPSCASRTPKTEIYDYKIINIYPHAQDAFTQGLVFEDGILYEGTGLNGKSSLRKVDLKSGNILDVYKLPDEFFGEGITVCGDKIIQLTWRSNTGFIYEKHGFNLVGKFSYPFEGWGITYNGRHLIASDGTPTLHFLNPLTFKEEATVKVHDSYGEVDRLNELEYINGEIYANVWRTERIARIDPETGNLLGWINLSGLLDHLGTRGNVDVLNGIAYDAKSEHLFVTGKLWPKIFEIEIAAGNN